MTNEAIILVPGLPRAAVSEQLHVFARGLVGVSERMPLREVEAPDGADDAVRLEGRRGGADVRIDVYEAYWNDLVPSLTRASLGVRVVRGLSLAWYWVASGVWWGSLRRKYLTFGLALSVVAFLAWYLGILVLFVEALAADPPSFLAGVMPGLEEAVDRIGGLGFWAVASALVGVLPLALLVDLSDFTKRYMSDEPSAPDTPPLRSVIQERIRGRVRRAVAAGTYDRVTIVGHSFGAVVAADYLADAPPSGVPVRLITMGSLLEVLARRAPWLKADMDRLARRPDLEEWVDIRIVSDWFASGARLEGQPGPRTVEVRSDETFVDKAAARVHARYFGNQETVREVLRTTDAAG
ncbi:MAG: hypothetical protein RH859_11190 [Longimicrobiales bacterium]